MPACYSFRLVGASSSRCVLKKGCCLSCLSDQRRQETALGKLKCLASSCGEIVLPKARGDLGCWARGAFGTNAVRVRLSAQWSHHGNSKAGGTGAAAGGAGRRPSLCKMDDVMKNAMSRRGAPRLDEELKRGTPRRLHLSAFRLLPREVWASTPRTTLKGPFTCAASGAVASASAACRPV
jgi:hypothetical protein